MGKATVTYEVEFTRNLGNFENVKPKFGVSREVEVNSADDLTAAKNKLADVVDGWLTEKVAELEAELKALGLGK